MWCVPPRVPQRACSECRAEALLVYGDPVAPSAKREEPGKRENNFSNEDRHRKTNGSCGNPTEEEKGMDPSCPLVFSSSPPLSLLSPPAYPLFLLLMLPLSITTIRSSTSSDPLIQPLPLLHRLPPLLLLPLDPPRLPLLPQHVRPPPYHSPQ